MGCQWHNNFNLDLAKRALQHKEEGIKLRKVKIDQLLVVVYHDAGWANAPDDPADPLFFLSVEGEKNGVITDGPWSLQDRKAKKKNSRVASQLGLLVVFTERQAAQEKKAPGSILEWKSHACDRVCRSTFGAETMACLDGVELAQYVRAMFFALAGGVLNRDVGKHTPLLALTDCRSLYDHMQRDGLPRTPCDRRLAIDVACLRQTLEDEKHNRGEDTRFPLAWLPTDLQRADVLTKPKKADSWWDEHATVQIPIRKIVFDQCKSEAPTVA